MSSITFFRIFSFDVKNPLYSWSPMSSATRPNGPFSPFVRTIHIGEMFVPSQLITSADDGGCGASSGLLKLPIIHACEILSKISIPDQGPCTDLEFMDYITAYGKHCKCGKDDWELLSL